MFFHQSSSVCFSPRSMTCLVSVFWPPEQYQAWIRLMEYILKCLDFCNILSTKNSLFPFFQHLISCSPPHQSIRQTLLPVEVHHLSSTPHPSKKSNPSVSMTTIQEIVPVSFLFLDTKNERGDLQNILICWKKEDCEPLQKKNMCVHTLKLPVHVYQKRKYPPFVVVNHHYNLI